MRKSTKFSPEVRERAVRMVQEQRGEYPSLWAAIESIATTIGCVPQTLNEWVKRNEVDNGMREGVTSSEAQRMNHLEREAKELTCSSLLAAFAGGNRCDFVVCRGHSTRGRSLLAKRHACSDKQLALSHLLDLGAVKQSHRVQAPGCSYRCGRWYWDHACERHVDPMALERRLIQRDNLKNATFANQLWGLCRSAT
jgi:transposase-like protein